MLNNMSDNFTWSFEVATAAAVEAVEASSSLSA
jgi:hypothetical protein